MSYINGSDLLLKIGESAVGHCTTHTLTFNSETKERAVKPVATEGKQAGLWKGKGITSLSISITAEGLRFYEETESGFEEISALWGKGQSVAVERVEELTKIPDYQREDAAYRPASEPQEGEKENPRGGNL